MEQPQLRFSNGKDALASVTFILGELLKLVIIIVQFVITMATKMNPYKREMLVHGLRTMAFSTDKRWGKQPDSGKVENITKSKRIILMRHAESAWNLVFNKGFNGSFPQRLGDALELEAKLAPTLDSVFVDSPLSEIGAEQADGLQTWIEESDGGYLEMIRGLNAESSVIASSNLRRALSTVTIGMWERLQRTGDKIHVLSSLQEITFNMDGVSLAKPGTAPVLSQVELKALRQKSSTFDYDKYYDCTENAGDKEVNSHGIDRMVEFADWCVNRPEDFVIAMGHSLYYRYFFRTFLPKSSNHIGKKRKMANCSVVALTLHQGEVDGKPWFIIDEDSIEPLHIGFEEKNN